MKKLEKMTNMKMKQGRKKEKEEQALPSSCPSEVQKAQAGSKEAAAAQKVVEEAQLAEQEKEWCAAGFSAAVCR